MKMHMYVYVKIATVIDLFREIKLNSDLHVHISVCASFSLLGSITDSPLNTGPIGVAKREAAICPWTSCGP